MLALVLLVLMLFSYVVPVGAEDPPPSQDPPPLVEGGDEAPPPDDDEGAPPDEEAPPPADEEGAPPDEEAPPPDDDEGAPPDEEAPPPDDDEGVGLFGTESGTVTITAPADLTGFTTGTVIVTGEAPANTPVTVTVQDDRNPDWNESQSTHADGDGHFTVTFSLHDSDYIVRATVDDVTSVGVLFSVDTAAPLIKLNFPEYTGSSVQLSGYVEDMRVGSVFLSVNSGPELEVEITLEPGYLVESGYFDEAIALTNPVNQIRITAEDELGNRSLLQFDLPDTYHPPTLSLQLSGSPADPGSEVILTGEWNWVYPGLAQLEAYVQYDPRVLSLPADWDPEEAFAGTFLGSGAHVGDVYSDFESETEAYLYMYVSNWDQINLQSRQAFNIPLQIRPDLSADWTQTAVAIASPNPDLLPPLRLLTVFQSGVEEVGYDGQPQTIQITHEPAIIFDDLGVIDSPTFVITGTAPALAIVRVELRTISDGLLDWRSVLAEADGRFEVAFHELEDGPYHIFAITEGFPTAGPHLVKVDMNAPRLIFAEPEWDGNVVTVSGWVTDRFDVIHLRAEFDRQGLIDLQFGETGAFSITHALDSPETEVIFYAMDEHENWAIRLMSLPQTYSTPTLRLEMGDAATYEPGDRVTIQGFLSWVPPSVTYLETWLAYDPAIFEPLAPYPDAFVGTFLGDEPDSGHIWLDANDPTTTYLHMVASKESPFNLDRKKAFEVGLRVRENAKLGMTAISIVGPDGEQGLILKSLEGEEIATAHPSSPYQVQIGSAQGEVLLSLTSPIPNQHGYVNADPLVVAGTAPPNSAVTVTVTIERWYGNPFQYTGVISADPTGAFSLTLADLPDGDATIQVEAGGESLEPLTFEIDTTLWVGLSHPVVVDGEVLLLAWFDEEVDAVITIDPDGAAEQIPGDVADGALRQLVPLTDGMAEIELKVTDLAGNVFAKRFIVSETDGPAKLRFETDQDFYMPGDLVTVTVHLDPVSPVLTGVNFWLAYDRDVLELVTVYDKDLDLTGSVFETIQYHYVEPDDSWEHFDFVEFIIGGEVGHINTTKLFSMQFRVKETAPNGETVLSVESPYGSADSAVFLRPIIAEGDLIPYQAWATGIIPIGPANPDVRLTDPAPGALLASGQVALTGTAPAGQTVTLTLTNLDDPERSPAPRSVPAVGGQFNEPFQLSDGRYKVVASVEDVHPYTRIFTVDTEGPVFEHVDYWLYHNDGHIYVDVYAEVTDAHPDALYLQVNPDGIQVPMESGPWDLASYWWSGYAPETGDFQVTLTAFDRVGNQTVYVLEVERLYLDLTFDKMWYGPGDTVAVTAYLSVVPPELEEIYFRLGIDPDVLEPIEVHGIPQYDITGSVLAGSGQSAGGMVSGQADWVSFELYNKNGPNPGTSKVVTLFFKVKESAPNGVTYVDVQHLSVYETDLPPESGHQYSLRISSDVGEGAVTGTVTPDAAAHAAGITVTAYRDGEEVASTQTDADGRFHLADVEAGHYYTLSFSRAGYLMTILYQVPVYPEETTDLSHMEIRLWAGNLLDTEQSHDRIYLEDLGVLARALRGEQNATADLNGDGVVDEADLALLRANYGRGGAQSEAPSPGQELNYVPPALID